MTLRFQSFRRLYGLSSASPENQRDEVRTPSERCGLSHGGRHATSVRLSRSERTTSRLIRVKHLGLCLDAAHLKIEEHQR